MSGARWHARIGAVGGTIRGAGVLVTPDRVLTCAHVVRELDRVKVEFPDIRSAAPVEGTVAWRGPWTQRGEPGDVAVISLDAVPAGPAPCKFADLEALNSRPGLDDGHILSARGFPERYGPRGVYVTMRTSAHRMFGNEWLQTDADKAHLQRLAKGFSGAGVYLPDSGAVVGMMTDADTSQGGEGGYTGLMLPLSTLRRYWDELDDLLPLPWLEPRECRRELRTLVAGMHVGPDLGTVVSAAIPITCDDPIDSLWQAIRFVGESGLGDDGVRRFLVMLASHLDSAAQSRLAAWANSWRNAWAQEISSARPPVTSIVVKIRTPVKNQRSHVEITAQSFVDGRWIASEDKVEAPRTKIRKNVETLVSAQVAKVRPQELMIEFAVEQDDLKLPFDEWHYWEPKTTRELPMRSVPLVVWNLSRLDPENFRASSRVRKRWRNLRGTGQTSLESVTCDLPYGYDDFYNWLDADEEVGAIAYASLPKRDWLEAALIIGIPVMVWCRQQCDGDGTGHAEHLARLGQLTAELSGTDASALPTRVARLRKEAMKPGTGEWHCGRHLTLFWDDPARLPLPDPPLTSWS